MVGYRRALLFDIDSLTWISNGTTEPLLNTQRSYLTCAANDQKIYVLGGFYAVLTIETLDVSEGIELWHTYR